MSRFYSSGSCWGRGGSSLEAGVEQVEGRGKCSINPLSPSIKLQILLLCFHVFLTEVVGRSC